MIIAVLLYGACIHSLHDIVHLVVFSGVGGDLGPVSAHLKCNLAHT